MTNQIDDTVNKTGKRYSSYTYDSPSILVRYPHRKRNKLISAAITSLNPEKWLDYGAGDGALVSILNNQNTLPTNVLLYEPEDGMHNQLCENLSFLAGRISKTSEWQDLNKHKYDLVTVLEVLEHLPLPERIKFYSLLAVTLNDNGKCLIEVPVEYGPILLLKEFGRKFIKHRKSEYSIRELTAAFFGRISDSHKRYAIDDERTFISPHRGFDLNRLLSELSEIGEYREIVRSPFTFLPRMFNQVMLFSFELTVRDEHELKKRIIQLYTS